MFDRVFRINPLFTITPFEDLSDEQKERFRHLTDNKKFYGFIHAPREAKLTVKAINRDLAEFLRYLGEPRSLRSALETFAGGNQGAQERFVVQLLLDGVLEMKADEEYISGVEAVNQILSPSAHQPHRDSGIRKNHIQILSDLSIDFAFKSALTQPRDLSFLLYNFNRVPQSRRWKQRLPDERAVATFLGLAEDGMWTGAPKWVRPKAAKRGGDDRQAFFDRHWRVWRLKEKAPPLNGPTYKVYFSPLPQDLPEVFRMVREAAPHSEAHAMKVGRTLSGVLRSDKLIVYFIHHRAALEFAQKMSRSLTSFHHQGTPFSFQVSYDNPIVSMGADPPRGSGEQHSWRLYLTNKLSLAIQGARREGAKNPTNYILSYMHLIGIDSCNWCPLNEDWNIEFFIEEQTNG